MSLLFVADLHLQDERPDITRAFLQLLSGLQSDVQGLYILGDLFEVWIGDDAISETASTVGTALKALGKKGIDVFFQHGNRDFLIGQTFADQYNLTLLPETQLITPYRSSLLLMHGDQLCIDDKDYQDFRQQVRSKQWQQQFLAQPLPARQATARHLRENSRKQNSQKPEAILDVSDREVSRLLANTSVDFLIHGHTHRPAIHQLSSGKQRIVLGDWGPNAWYLKWWDDDQFELIHHLIEDP